MKIKLTSLWDKRCSTRKQSTSPLRTSTQKDHSLLLSKLYIVLLTIQIQLAHLRARKTGFLWKSVNPCNS